MEKQVFKVSEIEISYRPAFKLSERPKVTSSNIAYGILDQSWDHNKMELLEEFKVLLLNRQNRVLGVLNVAQGGFSEVMIDPKVVFSAALKACASGIILSHNHPSSELSPSEADIRLTRKMLEGGKLLGIEVLDHLILSAYDYYSFRDEGMM
ncbi:JAB domain-containing protein [Pedobacter agri]|uniref:JAB domain-containing protein n=1 Tax=Pedobacter agri TaxID=454586 RepID=UPI0027854620|nr:JAB domain-containing protein [Pedobacter agri]MDQ1142814.1 DNA repair protein RadC [Pedobacter agri]